VATGSPTEVRAVVLVEGDSDRRAVEALAARRGRDLDAEGVAVVAIGGAHALGRFLERYAGGRVRLAGLCDVGEEGSFRRALERAGLGSELTREGMEALGFYVCDVDLEDELIRALGADAVLAILEQQGELRAFRTLQHRRFMGSGGSRKVRYASLLVQAVDDARMPRPLEGVLAHVG
jgi:hypothetical protein